MSEQRYVIVGAGGVGCALGGLLAAAGRDAAFVARGAQLSALQAGPLTIATPASTTDIRVRAVRDVGEAEVGPGDVVLLATKTQDVPGLVPDLRRCAGAGAVLVCCQNGVAAERWVSEAVTDPVSMVVFAPISFLVPGRVELHGTPRPGALEIGEHPAGISARVEAIAADLEAAGFAVWVEALIRRRKLGKLLLNLGNGLQALAGSTPDLARVNAVLQDEARACFRAAALDFADVEESMARYGTIGEAAIEGSPRAGGSTWQSFARGKPPETRFLNGEIVAMGEALGIPTPANRALLSLVEDASSAGRPPGTMSVASIEAAVCAQT